MPSTAMPSASWSNTSARPGKSTASFSARARTSSVSSSSRHGGAHSPSSATSRLRWSATLNQRTSSTASPQYSTRSGCSSVGGKTSRIPPRTANSPRFSTRSTRVYAAATRRSTTSSREISSPARRATGTRSPRPGDQRLQQAADRGDDNAQPPLGVGVLRMAEPAQHGQPAAHGVRARREALVRQRLPRRELRDRILRQ